MCSAHSHAPRCLCYAVGGPLHAELVCPSNNVDYNAIWPAGVTAGTLVQGAYCAPGWTGIIGRQCQLNGQWASAATGGCTRTGFRIGTGSGWARV